MKRACVIGWPIEHSRSPLIHGSWLQHYGLDGAYTKEAVQPDDLVSFLGDLDGRGFVGCNVTVPHKQAAFAAADIRHGPAEAVGAANTLWLESGKLHATNTDTYGFMAYLNEKAPDWHVNDPKIVVLGAGGASRAIIYGLLESGQSAIKLVNRTAERAHDVRAHFGDRINVVPWAERGSAIQNARLVINTTSLGMNGQGSPDVDLTTVDPHCVVCDIVYTPLETPFLTAAQQRGLKTVDGLGMLLHQAVPGFEKWFGIRPVVSDALYAKIAADVRGAA